MKIFTYSIADASFIGLLNKESVINFTRAWEKYSGSTKKTGPMNFSTVTEMIECGIFSANTFTAVLDFLKGNNLLETFTEHGDIKFELPIHRPTKIIALAMNYRAHAEELGNEAVKEPIFFSKTINTMLPHNGDIVYPKDVTRVDHEIELGVVMGKRAKDVNVEEANEYIAGYTIVNDITARDMQKSDMINQRPWLRSKCFDTFLPIGPYIVPKEFIEDVKNLPLVLTVNGKRRQHGNTRLMINSVDTIISYVSRFMTLFPGDIICTGTPEGVSPLKTGDMIEASIDGIGTLVNKVVNS